jgi:aspartyl protease family protein
MDVHELRALVKTFSKEDAMRFTHYAVTALAVTGLALLSQNSTIAQEGPCYMVTTSGQRVSLGKLCGEVAPSQATKATTPKDGIYRVKIKRRLAATPVIDVMLNGKPVEMIVDTGASGTLIPSSVARALNLQPEGFRNVIIADGSKVKFAVSSLQSVSAGGLTIRNLKVTIANNADIGLLGHDFFGQYDLKIRRDVVEFHPQAQ